MKAPLLVAGLALLASAATRNARAADADDAEASFAAGIHAYDHKDYEQALEAFQRAYAIKPSYKLLYNIGLSEVALGDSARAVDAFEGYVAGGVPAARAAEMRSTLEKLRTKVGEIVIDDAHAKAQLSVDGRPLAPGAGARPIHVNPGEHRVCAEQPGEAERCQVLTIAAGSRSALELRAPARPQPEVDPLPRTEREPAPQHDDSARWVAWSAAGAFAVGAAVTGVLALGAHGDQNDAEKTRGITRAELDQAHQKTQHLALATDLLMAGAAVSAGVALYLQLSSPHDASEAPHTSALLIVKPTGVNFALRF